MTLGFEVTYSVLDQLYKYEEELPSAPWDVGY